MPKPTVFVSYSHQDEAWKDRLVGHLRVLESGLDFETWDDRKIRVGSAWEARIKEAMDRTVAAVLLISSDFLSSQFIQEKEVPYLLGRREREGLPVIPVIARPCALSGSCGGWRGAGRGDGRPADPSFAQAVAEAVETSQAVTISSRRPRGPRDVSAGANPPLPC